MKKKRKLLPGASLFDEEIEKMDLEQNRALTPGERIEIVFELSDFIEELHESARRLRKVHQRHTRKK